MAFLFANLAAHPAQPVGAQPGAPRSRGEILASWTDQVELQRKEHDRQAQAVEGWDALLREKGAVLEQHREAVASIRREQLELAAALAAVEEQNKPQGRLDLALRRVERALNEGLLGEEKAAAARAAGAAAAGGAGADADAHRETAQFVRAEACARARAVEERLAGIAKRLVPAGRDIGDGLRRKA